MRVPFVSKTIIYALFRPVKMSWTVPGTRVGCRFPMRTLWFSYTEMELKSRNHASNLLHCAVTLLPRLDQLRLFERAPPECPRSMPTLHARSRVESINRLPDR